MGLTHIGDVLTHLLVEKPADGVRAAGRMLNSDYRAKRRHERAERMKLIKAVDEASNQDNPSVVDKEAAKKARQVEKEQKQHAEELRRANLLIETGQRMAASGHEELNRLRARDMMSETPSPTSSKSNGSPQKGGDEPAEPAKAQATRTKKPATKAAETATAESTQSS